MSGCHPSVTRLSFRTTRSRSSSSLECQSMTANLRSATASTRLSNSLVLSLLPMPASYANRARLRRMVGHLRSSDFIRSCESSMRQRTLAASTRWERGSIAAKPPRYSVRKRSEPATRSAMAAFSRASAAKRDWCLFVSRTTSSATRPPRIAATNDPTTPLHSWIHSGLSIPHNIPKAYRSSSHGLVQR